MSKIVIDAGHGGHDSGAASNGLKEKDLTLVISNRIRDKLKSYKQISVKMTRTTDKYLSLTQRTNIANSWGADAFVSVHINAGGGTGFESFIYNGNVSNNTKTLQSNMHSNIMKHLNVNVANRGKKRGNLAVVRQTTMPAILTENLFVDGDNAQLKKASILDAIAEGHVDGILKYFGVKKINKKDDETMSSKEYNKVMEEINALKKDKMNKPSNNQTPDKDHAENFKKAKSVGITDGSNPYYYITKQQAATMTVNALFNDYEPTDGEVDKAIAWAKEQGISDGSNPGHFTRRQQSIVMLYRMHKILIQEDVAIKPECSD